MDATRISIARVLDLDVPVSWREAAAVLGEAVSFCRRTGGTSPERPQPSACLVTRGGQVVLEAAAAHARPDAVVTLATDLLRRCAEPEQLGAAVRAGGVYLRSSTSSWSSPRRTFAGRKSPRWPCGHWPQKRISGGPPTTPCPMQTPTGMDCAPGPERRRSGQPTTRHSSPRCRSLTGPPLASTRRPRSGSRSLRWRSSRQSVCGCGDARSTNAPALPVSSRRRPPQPNGLRQGRVPIRPRRRPSSSRARRPALQVLAPDPPVPEAPAPQAPVRPTSTTTSDQAVPPAPIERLPPESPDEPIFSWLTEDVEPPGPVSRVPGGMRVLTDAERPTGRVLQLLVDRGGRVEHVQAVEGFDGVSLEQRLALFAAARRWQFAPCSRSGQPVRCAGPVAVAR